MTGKSTIGDTSQNAVLVVFCAFRLIATTLSE